MEILNGFEVPATLDEAWAMLLDIPRILPCLPGVELIEISTTRPTRARSRSGSDQSP